MADYEYNIHLPSEQKKFLMKLVNLSKQHNILSIPLAIHKPNEPPYPLAFLIDGESENITLHEDPISGFEILGFVTEIEGWFTIG